MNSHIIQMITVAILPLLFAITVHEASHAYAARYFGDSTAYMLGRVSLNPIKHIDPIGTVVFPILLLALGTGFVIGWAKPVPVKFGNLRNPKRDMIWVALAGPASNFVMSILWLILLVVLSKLAIDSTFFISMASYGVMINIVIMVFNLLPLPPLDGGRIITGLLPIRQAIGYSKIEPYGMYIIIGLMAVGILPKILSPIYEAVMTFLLYWVS